MARRKTSVQKETIDLGVQPDLIETTGRMLRFHNCLLPDVEPSFATATYCLTVMNRMGEAGLSIVDTESMEADLLAEGTVKPEGVWQAVDDAEEPAAPAERKRSVRLPTAKKKGKTRFTPEQTKELQSRIDALLEKHPGMSPSGIAKKLKQPGWRINRMMKK